MKIKLLLDEDVQLALAEALRKRGYDVLHVQELDRKSLTDAAQLNYACQEKRCFLSYNVKDFVLLHNDFTSQRSDHFGILVSKQLPIGVALKKTLAILLVHSQKSLKNQILFL